MTEDGYKYDEDTEEGDDCTNDFNSSWWLMSKNGQISDNEEGANKLKNSGNGSISFLNCHKVSKLDRYQTNYTIGKDNPGIV